MAKQDDRNTSDSNMLKRHPMFNDGDIIRVGIAGFGMSGRLFHAPFIHADPRFQLKKVFERSTERAKEEYPGVEVVHHFEEILTDDIDLVIIATPNKLHVSMAKQAILAGKNLIVEKPVAPTSAEAMELCRLANEKGVMFSVYQSRRFDGDFLTVKNVIASGCLGEVVDYECHYDRFAKAGKPAAWKTEKVPGNGPLYNLGVHIIDQVYVLFGMPDEVYADFRKQRPESAFPDNFEINFYYPDKKAIVSASEIVAHPGPHFMIHGRKGSFIKYGLDGQEKTLLQGKRPVDGNWGADDPDAYGRLYFGENDVCQVIPTESGNYGNYYDNIYRVLTEGAELYVRPEETVDVLRIMEAALMSNEQKRRIDVSEL